METILIIICIGFTIYYVYNIEKSSSKPKEYLIDNKFKEIGDSFKNEMDQQLEDMKVDRYIREEAYNKYRHYIHCKNLGLKFPGLYIGSHYGIYTIYDEKSAKYKAGDINKIIEEEYNKLIEKYELES